MSSRGSLPQCRVDAFPNHLTISAGDEDAHECTEPEYSEPEYPKFLLKRVKAVRKTPSVPGKVLVVVHKCIRSYSDQVFTIVGVYSTVGNANEVAMKVFKRDHAEFLK